MYRKFTVFTLVAALGVLALAGVASAATVKGKVVHKNKSAESFTVAKGSGQLVAVHAKRSPALGCKVVVRGRLLHNGTFGARSVTVGTSSAKARVHGVVTFVNARHTKFTVSGKGVSLVVRKHALKKTPAVGTVVTVVGRFTGKGDIAADHCRDCGHNDGYVEFEGHVLAIDTTKRTLTLSADDDCELSGSITVIIPEAWDMALYEVGDELEVVATLNADGTYTAVGTSKDGDEHEADDDDCDQGHNCADIEGDVVTVDQATRTLTMTVDDDDSMAGARVTILIPGAIDMSGIEIGDELEVVATLNADGTYTAVSIEQDDADRDCGDCVTDCSDDCGDDCEDCGDDCGDCFGGR